MKRTKEIAKEISIIAPVYLRNIYPVVLKSIDLPPSQIIALTTLDEKEDYTLGGLSKAMHVSAPTITGIIDRMEKAGYVKRIPDVKDRRITHIHLTEKGRVQAREFRNNIYKKWEAIIEKLSKDDQERWLSIFRKITLGLERESLDNNDEA